MRPRGHGQALRADCRGGMCRARNAPSCPAAQCSGPCPSEFSGRAKRPGLPTDGSAIPAGISHCLGPEFAAGSGNKVIVDGNHVQTTRRWKTNRTHHREKEQQKNVSCSKELRAGLPGAGSAPRKVRPPVIYHNRRLVGGSSRGIYNRPP